jgi:hypothetical protein
MMQRGATLEANVLFLKNQLRYELILLCGVASSRIAFSQQILCSVATLTHRTRDTPAYLSLPLVPAPARLGLLALRSFNAEIASIRDTTDQTTTGRLRLQWWRDSIDACVNIVLIVLF